MSRDGEAGSFLIESLVSAAILLVAIVALFSALDAQGAASDVARDSSVAGGLAEADQERLRSFRVPDLSNRRETQTITSGGASYTVESRADWIRDATGGTPSCANASTQADYLRLTSTVTGRSSGQQRGRPTVLRSIVAAPVGQFGEGQGTLAVKTSGAGGQPVQGAPTTITGPKTLSDASNEVGCAVFGYVPVGAYAVKVEAPGFVTPSGEPAATGTATATQGTTNLTELQYDRAGAVTVAFDTKVGSAAAKPAKARVLSAANSGIPATGFQRFPAADPATPQPLASITMDKLFPFTSAYTFYGGSCPAANPAVYIPDYFASNPGSQVVGPGSSSSITVRLPALNLRVRAVTSSALVRVRVRALDAGCAADYDFQVASLDAGAALPEPGLPFGKYSVCADVGGKFRAGTDVTLNSPAGSAEQTLDLRSGTTAGACP